MYNRCIFPLETENNHSFWEKSINKKIINMKVIYSEFNTEKQYNYYYSYIFRINNKQREEGNNSRRKKREKESVGQYIYIYIYLLQRAFT